MKIKKIVKKYILQYKYKNCKIRSSNISYDVILHDMVKIYNDVYIDKNCEIGKYTYISSGTKIYSKTTIGNYCSVGPNVIIGPGEHPLNQFTTHPIVYDKVWNKEITEDYHINEKTVIGNDVWIGCNAFIKNGVNIGTGAVIGACSVVTHNVPPYVDVVCNAAILIKYRFNKKKINTLLKSQWYDNDISKITKNISYYNTLVEQEKLR